MSITIIQQPTQFHPLYHQVEWIADSTIKTNDQFRYVMKIQVGAVIRNIKVSPRPGDGFGIIDISQHLKDFLDQEVADLKQTGATIIQAAAKILYNFQFAEEFKDGSGNTVTILGPEVSIRIGMNTIFNRNDILGFTEAKWKLTDANTDFLWNVEDGFEAFKDDIFFIHIAADVDTYEVNFTEHFKDGTLSIGGASISFNDFTNLLRVDLSLLLTDPDNAVKFCIDIKLSAVNVSMERCIDLVDGCSRFTNHKIIYLDDKGSYNSLNFDHASRKTDTANPKTYTKYIEGTTQQDVSRPITRYFNDPTTVHTVNTDNLTDKHNIMLVDLINSDQAFLDVRNDGDFPDADFLPIEILTRTIEEAKSENQELAQFTIQYRFSFDKIGR